MWIKAKDAIFSVLFPQFCFNCRKEGSYLCQDCQSLLEISGFHRNYSTQNLDNLYFAADYKNPLIKRIIRHFKYEPFVKELGKPLSSLIVAHFQLMDNKPNFSKFILIPVPLHRKRLKWREFNQAEILAKELADFFRVPLFSSCLTKVKETLPRAELYALEKKENVRGIFSAENRGLIRDRNILLVDDVYTDGAAIEEAARVLKRPAPEKSSALLLLAAKKIP